MNTDQAQIFVRFRFPGWHCWPTAPEPRAYLRDQHRHLFHAEVSCMVAHDDREIEFHDLQDDAIKIVRELGGAAGRFGSSSCEAIARQLGARLVKWHGRAFMVTVSEDGEVGATVMVPGPSGADPEAKTADA